MNGSASESTSRGGRLHGKVAIVIGAGSVGDGLGNGRATAIAFAFEGATLFLVDRDEEALQVTAAALREACMPDACWSLCVADVTREDSVRDMVAQCGERHGRVDVLHNNVGTVITGSATSASIEDWERAFRVNVLTAAMTSRAVAPFMRRQGSGSIVNISSISSVRALDGSALAPYAVAKAALNHLTRATAVELAPHGVRCNAIVPGFIDTPMVQQSVLAAMRDDSPGTAPALDTYLARRSARIPMGRWGDARDVAHAAVFLASDESRYVTGIALTVDGGASLIAG